MGALGVRGISGRGLMVGLALHGGAARALRIARSLLECGYIVLTGGVAGDVLTFTPALTIESSVLHDFDQALLQVLKECSP